MVSVGEAAGKSLSKDLKLLHARFNHLNSAQLSRMQNLELSDFDLKGHRDEV
jgi:hypothetical protein